MIARSVAALQVRPADPRGRERLAVAGLVGLSVVFAAFLLYVGRNTTFFYDEWSFLLGRRGVSTETLLSPHNGNLSVVPIALFKALLQIGGADSYWLFRVTLVAFHLIVVLLVYLVGRRHASPVVAALAAGLVLVMGQSADNMIWPAQFGFVLAVIGGLVALLGIDWETRRGDLLAAAGLALALASSSNGVPFVAVVAVIVLWKPSRWRRAWVVLVPVALYGLWSLGYGDSQVMLSNASDVPAFGSTMAATAAGAVLGFNVDLGRPMLVLAAAALAWWFLRGGRVDGRVVGMLAGLLAMWTLTPLARAAIEDPSAPRYSYVAVVVMVLIGCAAVGRRAISSQAAWLAVVILVLAGLAGSAALVQRGDALRDHADDIRARLAAVDLAGAAVPPDFLPIVDQPQIVAGPAQQAQRDLGRIADRPEDLARGTAAERTAADEVLRRLNTFVVGPVPAGTTKRACRTVAPDEESALPDASTGLVVVAPEGAEIRTRAFADAAAPLVTALPGSVVVRHLASAAAVPWRFSLVGAGRLRVCTVR